MNPIPPWLCKSIWKNVWRKLRQSYTGNSRLLPRLWYHYTRQLFVPERKAIQYHPICSSPPALEIYAAHLLSVTLALKSPFLCVKRSLIRYGFRAGTKAISYNVNIALFTICSFTYFSILFCFVFYASSIFFLDTHLRTNAQLGTPQGHYASRYASFSRL